MRKSEKIIFYILIFLLPFQVRRLVFSFTPIESSFYHQAFIYLSDALIVSLLGFWGWRIFKNREERDICFAAIKKDFSLILFLLFSGLSIFAATGNGLAIFHFTKLFEFILFYFYIRQNFQYIDIKKLSYILIGTVLIQVFISGLQFYFQQSIGGMLRYFGESPLSSAIPGVAKIDEGGFKLIRTYGTFPHPNIFAAFLILAAFMSHYVALSNASFFQEMRHKFNAAFMTHSLIIFALLLGLFLTFSKIALTSFSVIYAAFFIFLYFKNGILQKIIICKVFLPIFLIFISLFIVFNQEIFARFSEAQSISQRIFYSDIAFNALASSPIFGVGIGNFIDYFYNTYPALPSWQYQPVHNLFLLIASETGIITGFLFVLFVMVSIYRFLKNKNNQPFDWVIFIVFINFLILANFDHYFWTLQQGQILFWLIFGIVNSILKTGSQIKI